MPIRSNFTSFSIFNTEKQNFNTHFLCNFKMIASVEEVLHVIITVVYDIRLIFFYFPNYTGCLKIIVFRVRGLVGDILLTK
jgi:hypothetical protein